MLRNSYSSANPLPHSNLNYFPESADIITQDKNFRRILARLPLYAKSDLPVLLTGEPGTGKELVARAFYSLNPRRQSWQRLNCAALTESLACSELFGHLRGAFTDARHSRPGKFRLAHNGTLFLDEVGDLPLSVQAKLLRAAEQGEIEPVGGDEPVQVDVRLVTATNQNLPRLIAQGLFRQDLYDRLAVLDIQLPPLRERDGDILLLAERFAQEASRHHGRGLPVRFTRAARRRLQEYDWPGNVRELKNVVTRAVILNTTGRICREEIYFTPHPTPARGRARRPLREILRPSQSHLKELLSEEGGNISALSRRLQVSTKTIYRWLRADCIDLRSIRRAGAYA